LKQLLTVALAVVQIIQEDPMHSPWMSNTLRVSCAISGKSTRPF
ncbi:hypothetical protein CapIbe_024166, partial [Capra ibex]